MTKRKRTNNDIQNMTQKTKDQATGTPLKTESELVLTPVMLLLNDTNTICLNK